MKISRLGHFVRVAVFTILGLVAELVTPTAAPAPGAPPEVPPITHLAWAPALMLAARWAVAETEKAAAKEPTDGRG